MRTLTLLLCLVATTAVALAQDKSAAAAPSQEPPKATTAASQGSPLVAFDKKAHGYLKDVLLRSAEKMPEENYSFKPTDTVRSFGQVLGHVADSQYYFCSMVLGEKNPAPKIEQTKTSKADLVGALKDVFAYCDKAYEGITDTSATQTVKLFGGEDTPKKDVLTINNMHTVEHYGNLVTYLRMKNIVPPSSEPKESQPQPKK
jgi:uncharacterized damage-inducible protein DinB